MPLRVSVVVCTRNRPDRLAALLADLREQPAEEVVVVDQSDAVRPLVGVIHIVDEGRGLPRARNLGVARSQGDVVLFFDDDVRLLPGCVEAHREAYRDPLVGGVVGRIVERSLRPNAPSTTNRIDRCGRVRTNLEGLAPVQVEVLKGANMSFRRAALDGLGSDGVWFDEGYAGTAFLEDADLSARVAARGWVLRYVPQAGVVHLSEPSGGVRVGDRLRTERWRFHNTGRFLRKTRGALSVMPALATFSAIALRRSWELRRPDAAPWLMGAFLQGVVTARR